MNHRHTLHLLAREGAYLVQYCEDCEIAHVEVGPVTIRLRPGALDALARVLQHASMELHRAGPEEQTLRLLPNAGLVN